MKMTLNLDFTKCKNKEDVDKVFKEHKEEINKLNKFIKHLNQNKEE